VATNPATVQDLVNRSLRPLTVDEATSAPFQIGDAWNQIIRIVPSIPGRLDANEANLSAAVVQVICAAVLRLFANPEGKLEEHGDDYGYRFDSAISRGALYISDEEIEQLSIGTGQTGGAFTIRPTGTIPDPPLRYPKIEPFG
jgi:hypothetical protein